MSLDNITGEMKCAPSPTLFADDRVKYIRFYRLVSMAHQISDAYVVLVKQLNWDNVAVISYADHFMSDICASGEQTVWFYAHVLFLLITYHLSIGHTTQGLEEGCVHVILDFS